MNGWTVLGVCCLVAAGAYWLGAAVERHLSGIDAARRGDARFARAHRVDRDSYTGRGRWADEASA